MLAFEQFSSCFLGATMNWKELAKTAAIAIAVVAAYHNGILNFVPVLAGSKK